MSEILFFFTSAISTLTASATSRAKFNSKRGLNATLIENLIQGFYSFISTSLYSTSTYELSKSVLYTITNKKLQALSTSNLNSLSSITTKLSTIKAKMKIEVSSIQTQIFNQNETPLITASTITKISYPFTGTISAISGLKGAAEKIRILKALFANRNGLESTIRSIITATESTSTTGTEGKFFQFEALFNDFL